MKNLTVRQSAERDALDMREYIVNVYGEVLINAESNIKRYKEALKEIELLSALTGFSRHVILRDLKQDAKLVYGE